MENIYERNCEKSIIVIWPNWRTNKSFNNAQKININHGNTSNKDLVPINQKPKNLVKKIADVDAKTE